MKFEMTPEQVAEHQRRVDKPNPLMAEAERLAKRAAVEDKPTETESKIQQRGVAMARAAMELMSYDSRLLVAVPNGADVSDGNRMRLVAEGMTAGVPDLELNVGAGGYLGLKIEVKRPGGKLAKNQDSMMSLLGKQNYLCKVAYSAEEIRDIVIDYLEG